MFTVLIEVRNKFARYKRPPVLSCPYTAFSILLNYHILLNKSVVCEGSVICDLLWRCLIGWCGRLNTVQIMGTYIESTDRCKTFVICCVSP